MSHLKQLLPWPPQSPDAKPLVAAAFHAIARVCDEKVVAVDQAVDVIAAPSGRAFHSVKGNSMFELFTSNRLGILTAKSLDASAQLLVQPANHLEVRRDTLDSIIAAATEQPDRAVLPQFRGHGGHPVLILAFVTPLIRGYAPRGGLRQFWIERPDLCMWLPVDDSSVVFDVYTQSDYDFRVQ